jgi:hypothetical protein
MKDDSRQYELIESRLLSVFASLAVSVPTAALIWIGVNKELAFWGGFLGSSYLVVCIIVFAVLALLFPRLFPSILGNIWRGIIKIQNWWGW